ncbi:hypothetical protein [Candidatus Kryptobacter tengchongensis]|uniref:hypothetical protein n=1 Tax=Kryptobacter tengchongensis TaxID=1643429 RepID=UPI0007079F61|nr:hypothetical protein [Candidatus Kryptobacter tengchongensis]CUS84966.1 hypothetical protein JGI20_00955 [Candidatus Kryptobacter tengchongensis]
MRASEIIQAVDEFSGGRLREKNSLEVLLTIAVENNLMNLVDDIAFHSKFLWRVFNFLKSGRKIFGETADQKADEERYKARLTSQISESVERIRSLILKILERFPEVEKQRFFDKFLKIDAESFENFMNLVHDFYWFKNWRIDEHGKEI